MLVGATDGPRPCPNPADSDGARECITLSYVRASGPIEGYTLAMPATAGSLAIASATFRDLVRRPGLLLAAIAMAALLALLPDICMRAVDDSAALTLQVGLSSITAFLMLAAGFAGLRAGAAEGDLGATPEWLTAPVGPFAYVTGRFAGICALCAALLVVMGLVLLPAQRAAPPDALPAAFGFAGALVTAAQFAALGTMLAALLAPQLAAVVLVAAIVASRTVVPQLDAAGGVPALLAAALPDPVRVDLSREIAFHRPVDAASASFALLGAALQAAALLVVAAWCIRRRET